jgi:hypothetical protein
MPMIRFPAGQGNSLGKGGSVLCIEFSHALILRLSPVTCVYLR